MLKELFDTNCYYPLDNGEHFIYDDNINNIPVFLKEEEKWNLKIVNNSNNKVDFFQNDNCIMKDNAIKKCDWICFDHNKFYFIEAKDVRPSSRKKERKGAKDKFIDTLEFYKKYSFPIEMKKYAILNFRNNRIVNTANKTNKAIYKDLGLDYLETNMIEFN